jgi:hypothetical protein
MALDWAGPKIKVATHLVWNPQRHLGSAEEAFLNHARALLLT